MRRRGDSEARTCRAASALSAGAVTLLPGPAVADHHSDSDSALELAHCQCIQVGIMPVIMTLIQAAALARPGPDSLPASHGE